MKNQPKISRTSIKERGYRIYLCTVKKCGNKIEKPFVEARIKKDNLLGQEVKTLVDEEKRAGEYEVLWDGKDNFGNHVASGIYFYQIRVKNFTETKKLVLLK